MSLSKRCTITLTDEVNCIVGGIDDIYLKYFYDLFAYFAKNYFFNPKYEMGIWDGKIRFFERGGKTYIFLLDQIVPLLVEMGYEINIIDKRLTHNITPKLIDENYFSHIIDEETNEPFTLRDYQVNSVNAVLKDNGGIIVAGTGAGKAQPLICNILTLHGWVKMGELKVGDSVINPTRGQAKIIEIFPQGEIDTYKINFNDGASTLCCRDHLWKVNILNEDKIISTNDILTILKDSDAEISIPIVNYIKYRKQRLVIPPYVLGVLLAKPRLKHIIDCVIENKEIYDRIESLLPRNFYIRHLEDLNTRKNDYGIRKRNSYRYNRNFWVAQVKNFNLFGQYEHDTFIPDPYIHSSREQRIALLQGMFDTNCELNKNGIWEFYTFSEEIADNVREVLWSLGVLNTIQVIPGIKKKSFGPGKENKTSYSVSFKNNDVGMFFSTSNKKKLCIRGGANPTKRIISSIEYAGKEFSQCILLDSDNHLYITDDYIITHNTKIAAAIMGSYGTEGLKTITIVPSQDLITQTKEEYTLCELDVGEYSGSCKDTEPQHIVSTWQALQNNPNLMRMFQVVIVDECHISQSRILRELIVKHGKNIPVRIGLTGTLPKEMADISNVKISLGEEKYSISAKELIDRDVLAKIQINILQLEEDFTKQYAEYEEEYKINRNSRKKLTYKQFKDQYFPDYTTEKKYLETKPERLDWMAQCIIDMNTSKKGNVFCLVNSVTFGKKLAKLIPDAMFIYGADKKEVRKEIYDLFKVNDNITVIATVGIASTGINIKRIFNLVLINSTKSYIRIIQSIGRGLRKAKDKDSITVTDICSDLKYARKHVAERVKYYKEAEYPYTKKKITYYKS